MKGTLALLAVVLLAAGATLAFSPAQEKAQWKYLTVRVAPNAAHDMDINSQGGSRKLRETILTPLDSLGRDGWELVAITTDPGGNYVCFFKARK